MSKISAIALNGIQQASKNIAINTQKISTSSDLGDPKPAVEIKQSEISFKANTKLIEVDKKLGDYLLDIIA